ncbi:MAG TPA: Nramp family divalent metal transporter [Candidatus Acidoferrales bacterium]|jgi:manganese transport protein|nr:Nramp family divalent metal transporter [Candidatus Acidoferrales bacterium]
MRPDSPARARSLGDVNASVTTAHASVWRRLLAFAGPAYLVSVGYMDPGNWATDLEGGAKFGYQLLWVLVMSNGMAILFQTLSARLGVVAGRDLAQACREAYPRPISLALWVLCEIGIAACDLAEVLGAAIALNLLFNLPLLIGVLVTVADTLLLLWMQQYKIRTMEALVLRIILIVAACLGMEIFLAKPAVGQVMAGVVPRLTGENVYLVIAMLGATVMPHNLYLHSALVQTRRIGTTREAVRRACKYNLVDTLVALNGAMFVNIALLVLAGAVLRGQAVTEIRQVTKLLEPALGTSAAVIMFAVALLSVGQASALTGTMAGQIVMEGFLDIRMRAWMRRLVTRMLAIVPAVLTIYLYGETGVFQLLILSQVVLSMQLPFAVIPLVHFTGDRRWMGEFANNRWLHGGAWILAGVVMVLNVGWAGERILSWAANATSDRTILLLVLPLFAAMLLLLIYVLVAPWLKGSQTASAPTPLEPDIAADVRQPPAYLEQVKAGNAEHLSEARFEAFMQHLRGIAFIKNPEGKYIYFNGACATLLGLNIDEALNKTDDQLWPPELAGVYKKNDLSVLGGGKTFEGIEPILQNGEIRSWLMYRFPIVEGETRQVFLGAVGVDISGREEFEERVLRSRKFEVIGRMAGGIAHHFNNLLTVISGYSHMAVDEIAPTDKSQAYLEEVIKAADSLTTLTSHLLAFSRHQMLQLREVDLNVVVREEEPVLRRLLGDRIQLSLELSPNLASVKADAKYIERVIATLAFNARDAMKGTGGRLTIATSNVQSGRPPCVKLSVRDTGAGMVEETKVHLFEPFFTTKQPGEGAGLGLSSVYGIVKQHGGEITVTSQLGVGTTFEVFLPAVAAADSEARTRTAS